MHGRVDAEWQNHRAMQGRDANRKLQRAIKAGKARDRMPTVIEQMQGMVEAWIESEDRPFLYDGRDYKVQMKQAAYVCQMTSMCLSTADSVF